MNDLITILKEKKHPVTEQGEFDINNILFLNPIKNV